MAFFPPLQSASVSAATPAIYSNNTLPPSSGITNEMNTYALGLLEVQSPHTISFLLQWSNKRIQDLADGIELKFMCDTPDQQAQAAQILWVCEEYQTALDIVCKTLKENKTVLSAWSVYAQAVQSNHESLRTTSFEKTTAGQYCNKLRKSLSHDLQTFISNECCTGKKTTLITHIGVDDSTPFSLKLYAYWNDITHQQFQRIERTRTFLDTLSFESIVLWTDHTRIIQLLILTHKVGEAETWCDRFLNEVCPYAADVIALKILLQLKREETPSLRHIEILNDAKNIDMLLLLTTFFNLILPVQELIKKFLLRCSRDYLRALEKEYWLLLKKSDASKKCTSSLLFCTVRQKWIGEELLQNVDKYKIEEAQYAVILKDKEHASRLLESIVKRNLDPLDYIAASRIAASMSNSRLLFAFLLRAFETDYTQKDLNSPENSAVVLQRTDLLTANASGLPVIQRYALLEKALSDLQKCSQQESDHFLISKLLVNYLLNRSDPSLEKHLDLLNQKNAPALYKAARLHLLAEIERKKRLIHEQGEISTEISLLAHSLELYRNYYTALNLAELYLQKGAPLKAQKILLTFMEEVRFTKNINKGLCLLYETYEKLGDHTTLIAEFETHKPFPNNCMFSVANAFFQTGDYDKATQYMEVRTPKTEAQRTLIDKLKKMQKAKIVVQPKGSGIPQFVPEPLPPKGSPKSSTSANTTEAWKPAESKKSKRKTPKKISQKNLDPNKEELKTVSVVSPILNAPPLILDSSPRELSITVERAGSFASGVLPLELVPREPVEVSDTEKARLRGALAELDTLQELMVSNEISAAAAASEAKPLAMDLPFQRSYAHFLIFRMAELLCQVERTQATFTGLRNYLRHAPVSITMEFIQTIYETCMRIDLKRELQLLIISKAPQIDIPTKFKRVATPEESLITVLKKEINLVSSSSFSALPYKRDVAQGSLLLIGSLLSTLRDKQYPFERPDLAKKYITLANNLSHLPGDFAVLNAGATPVIVTREEIDNFLANIKTHLREFY